MLHKPPCRQIEKQARTFVAYPARVYKRRVRRNVRQIHGILTDADALYQRGIFPLTVFCKNGDITNPELSGGKMPDAGRNMTWDLRAPAPTPSHLRATVAIKGSFRGAEF